MPNKDMALLSIVHKEVDKTRDPRLHISHPESPPRSPDNDIGDDGWLSNKYIDQQTLSDVRQGSSVQSRVRTLPLSTARDWPTSGGRKSSNDRLRKHYTGNVGDHNGTGDALRTSNGQVLSTTRKEMRPLQLQKNSAVSRQSRSDVQTKTSTQHSKRKGKQDLNEILRKRLAKLEAQLDMVGSEHLSPDVNELDEDVAKETEDGKGLRSMYSSVGKKRKMADNGNGKFGKRLKTSDDETARIIAANVGGNMADSPDAKLDKYISAILTNETNPDEGLLSMSADFSEEISSMIESHLWNDERGKLTPSPSAEQLLDTETIMLNVLDMTDTRSSPPRDRTQDTETNDRYNAAGTPPQIGDRDTTSFTHQSMENKFEKQENVSGVEGDDEGSKHIGCLSVDTQWDSQFVESFVVKSTHLNSVRDWRSKKLLDLLISGRLKEMPVGTLSEQRHEGTDKLVASSLQNILSNLSWLWSVAVGGDMLDSIEDVVSCTASNLDSLFIDFVDQSGSVDIPVSVHLSNDQTADDVTGTEVAAEQEPDEPDDWLSEECLLLEGLATSFGETREKVLNQKHAISSAKNATDTDIPADLYSPTRPTELDLASSAASAISGDVIRSSKGVSELQFLHDADVTNTLNELVENSAPSRRTVRVFKKGNAVVKTSSDRMRVETSKRVNAGSKMKELPVFRDSVGDMSSVVSDTGFANDKPVLGTRIESRPLVSEELLMNQPVDISSLLEAEIATDGSALGHTFIDKMRDREPTDVADVAGQLDSVVENEYEMNSLAAPVAACKAKSSKKHSNSHDESSGKSRSYRTDVKKDGHSRKHKEHDVNVSGKKNKKKIQDTGKLTERQLKLSVKSELNHVQKSIKSMLADKYGITVENVTKLSRSLSLRAYDVHFPDLSGLSFDASLAMMAAESDDILKSVCLTPLLNDVLTELNIPLSAISLSMPENTSSFLTDRSLGEKMPVEVSGAGKLETESRSSPPTLRRRTAKQSGGVSRRSRISTEEASGTSIVPQRRQDAATSENEKRLMKADKLMQTFRRSQIAKRQSLRASPQPPASFIKQVQTVVPSEPTTADDVTPSEPTRSDSIDGDPTGSAPEVKEPDFTAVITDGSLLASVELPHLPPKSLPPQTDVAAPVESRTSSSQLPVASETVIVSIPPVPSSEITVGSSTDHKTSTLETVIHSIPPVPSSEVTLGISTIHKTSTSEMVIVSTPSVSSSEITVVNSAGYKTCTSETVIVSTTPVPSSEITVSNSASYKTSTIITSAGKEQRVYVFNIDKPLCREVKVCV